MNSTLNNSFEELFHQQKSKVENGYFITINPEEFVQQTCLIMEYYFKQIPIHEFLLAPNYADSNICNHISKLFQLKSNVRIFILFSVILFYFMLFIY